MADQSERPERIWLLHEIGDEGSDVWCGDPAPNHLTLDQPDSTEYVRADAFDARDAEIARLRYALRRVRDKRNEMDMGDLSSEEAVWEADEVAEHALNGGNDES